MANENARHHRSIDEIGMREFVAQSELCDIRVTFRTLMMALERLSPLERAAFLSHDVFGESMEEVAITIDRTPAATRQLAARARAHVQTLLDVFVEVQVCEDKDFHRLYSFW